MTTRKSAAPKLDTKQMEEAVAVGKENFEQAVKASTEGYEKVITMGKEQVEKSTTTVLQAYDELTTLNKDAVDAAIKAGNVWAAGFEAMGKAYFAFAQATAETGVEAAKSMMTAKTVQDVFEIQSELARSSFDSFVAEGTKISEMGVKVANEAMEPIQAQFNTTVEKILKPVAA